MDYNKLCQLYESLEKTSKTLEKTKILADFLSNLHAHPEWIYLLQGKVFPDYDERELGISDKLVIKALAKATGLPTSRIVQEYRKKGDLGKVAQELISKNKKQTTLFSKKLTVEKVLKNLQKLPTLEGKGTISSKIDLIVEILNSANPLEAKYITRTVLGDLKIGVGAGTIRDAIVLHCFHPKNLEEKRKYAKEVESAYNKITDFAEVFEKAIHKKLSSVKITPGKPLKVMLYPKAENIKDAFRIVGKPAAFEYKYDGFRMMINKDEKGNIKLFTRRLEDVTKQFPDAVKYAKEFIKAKSFIVDSEAVGFDAKTKTYTPFQAISQRIKRKYNVDKMAKELPIELTVFDILYYNGEALIEKPFKERRKILDKIVKQKPYKIRLAKQIITDNEKEVEKFLNQALKENQEGLMAKNLNAPYKPGSRIGYGVKIKPEGREFDLVITGAEWGTGKRAGWLTSFDIACRNRDKLLEVGKVSTGLKELEEQGLSFKEMTKILRKEIIEEKGRKVKVRPRTVVTVQYQDIQKSPTYTSGYALRFPRIKTLRPDRRTDDIATLHDIEREYKKQQ